MKPAADRPGDDQARDAHLVAALRHAPDRDLVPPDALSQRILAQARAGTQAARQREAPVRAGWWPRALDALFGRPQWAAAFGTLAVATLVGVMWSTREPAQEPPLARAPAAQPAAVATPPAAAAQGEVLAAAPSVAQSVQGGTQRVSPPRRDAAARAAPAAPPVLADAPAGRAEATVAPVQERSADADAAGSAVTAIAPRAAPAAAVEARRDSLSAAPLAALKASAPPIDPLVRMDALLDGAAGAPTWQVAGRRVLHGPVQRAWWAAVSEATRGRWQREDGTGDTLAPWLLLSLGSGAEAALWIEGSTLRLHLGADHWRAALPESTLRDWRASVARW